MTHLNQAAVWIAAGLCKYCGNDLRHPVEVEEQACQLCMTDESGLQKLDDPEDGRTYPENPLWDELFSTDDRELEDRLP